MRHTHFLRLIAVGGIVDDSGDISVDCPVCQTWNQLQWGEEDRDEPVVDAMTIESPRVHPR
jgi:hypothetical protein